MKLMFVRHAEPDYRHDSLTVKGHREAELLSRRLCKLDVKDFYVSPLGRTQETARYTLEKLGRQAETLPWLQEFRGRIVDPETGRERICWDMKPRLWQPRRDLYDSEAWLSDDLMQTANVPEIWQETIDGLDALLARYGFTRSENAIYLAENNTPDTIVLFCHLGMTLACLAHLLNLSPAALWHGFCCAPSSVTTLVTEERVKGEVVFRCMQLGDIGHLYAGDERHSTAALFPECYTGVDNTNPPEWKELGYE